MTRINRSWTEEMNGGKKVGFAAVRRGMGRRNVANQTVVVIVVDIDVI